MISVRVKDSQSQKELPVELHYVYDDEEVHAPRGDLVVVVGADETVKAVQAVTERAGVVTGWAVQREAQGVFPPRAVHVSVDRAESESGAFRRTQGRIRELLTDPIFRTLFGTLPIQENQSEEHEEGRQEEDEGFLEAMD